MPIEGFDYKAIAINFGEQANEVLFNENSFAAPENISDEDKKNIVDIVKKFCYMSGEALSNGNHKLNANQALFITQLVGEWTLHKSIDLISGNIPEKNRIPILQAIAGNIFMTAKLALVKKMPNDNVINLIEEKVNNVYKTELHKLLNKGELSEEQFNIAVNKSNLKDMVEKTTDESKLTKAGEGNLQGDRKVLKLAALAILLKKLPRDKAEEILTTLDRKDVVHVINYMKMSDIEDKIDHEVIIKTLEEIKRLIPVSESDSLEKLIKRHRRLIKITPPNILSKMVLKERAYVKDFILDSDFPAKEVFSPNVIKSLVRSIEEKINDN